MSEPTPFQKFEQLAKTVVRVPKKEIVLNLPARVSQERGQWYLYDIKLEQKRKAKQKTKKKRPRK